MKPVASCGSSSGAPVVPVGPVGASGQGQGQARAQGPVGATVGGGQWGTREVWVSKVSAHSKSDTLHPAPNLIGLW